MDKYLKNSLLYYFLGGFLFVFGLVDNPIRSLKYRFKKDNDMENIKRDWINVGNSIQKAYEKAKTESHSVT
jgi:hypothetical protein